MLKIRIFCSLSALLLLFGCAAQGPALKTASGRPEVFIAGVSPAQVRALIIDRSMSNGWTLEREMASL
jgi:hypothetical protein